LAIAFGILAVSTASIFIRYAQEDAPSLVIAAFRLTIATLVLSPLALTRHRTELKKLTRKEVVLALLSGVFLALHFATWISSLEYTTVASSVVLVSTMPLWVALLSPFTIKEPLSRAVFFGLILALIGGTIVGLSDACAWENSRLTCPAMGDFLRGEAFIGDLLALTGAVMGACYILIGRQLRSNVSLITYIFLRDGSRGIDPDHVWSRTFPLGLPTPDLPVVLAAGLDPSAPGSFHLQLGVRLSFRGLRFDHFAG
jgi:drug/metabolite transporter (DMT)-like permease